MQSTCYDPMRSARMISWFPIIVVQMKKSRDTSICIRHGQFMHLSLRTIALSKKVVQRLLKKENGWYASHQASAIRSLMYIMACNQLDIASMIGLLSQF